MRKYKFKLKSNFRHFHLLQFFCLWISGEVLSENRLHFLILICRSKTIFCCWKMPKRTEMVRFPFLRYYRNPFQLISRCCLSIYINVAHLKGLYLFGASKKSILNPGAVQIFHTAVYSFIAARRIFFRICARNILFIIMSVLCDFICLRIYVDFSFIFQVQSGALAVVYHSLFPDASAWFRHKNHCFIYCTLFALYFLSLRLHMQIVLKKRRRKAASITKRCQRFYIAFYLYMWIFMCNSSAKSCKL